MTTFEEFREQTVEQHHLARQVDDVFEIGRRAFGSVVEFRQRVVRDLSQVRHDRSELCLLVVHVD